MLKKVFSILLCVGIIVISTSVFAIDTIEMIEINPIIDLNLLDYSFLNQYKFGEKTMFGELYGDSLFRFGLYNGNIEVGQIVLDENSNIVNLNLDKQLILFEKNNINDSVTKLESLNTANKWLDTLSIDLKEDLNLEPIVQENDDRYLYYYYRLVEGIEFPENYVQIEISKKNGSLLNYDRKWELEPLEDLSNFSNIASFEQAQEIYLDKIGYELYIDLVNNKIKSVYSPKFENLYYLDGNTLEFIRNDAQQKILDQKKFNYDEFQRINRAAIVGVLTDNDIFNILKNQELIDLNEDCMEKNIILYKSVKGEYIYSVNLKFENKYVEAHINGINGEILDFVVYNNKHINEQLKITEDNSLQIAQDYLKKYYLKYYNNSLLEEKLILKTDKLNEISTFKFRRKIGDGISKYEYLDIDIDKIDGKIVGFEKKGFFNSADIEYDMKTIVDMNEKLADKMLLKRKIIRIDNELRLIYYVDTEKPYELNGLTGNWLKLKSDFGKDKEYTDLMGHYIRQDIMWLGKKGIKLPGDKFFPEKYSTKEDILILGEQLLGIEFDLYNKNELYLLLDVDKNKDNIKITNEVAYKFFIKILGEINRVDLDSVLSNEEYYEIAIQSGFNGNLKEYMNSKRLTRSELIHILYLLEKNASTKF